jgi:hypothetical protein
MSRWQDHPEEELDDEEIARILQEEEYEIARQNQQQQQRQQAQQPRPAQKTPVQVVGTRSSGPHPPASTDELLLLLQSRCSAVSGTTVLNGSCYLYRNMFKFVCVERNKEVAVSIYISTIEYLSLAFAPKTSGVPRVVPNSAAEPNVLQIFTQDKRIHTFFNFVDGKTFQKFYNILSSIHKNHTAAAPASSGQAAAAAAPSVATSSPATPAMPMPMPMPMPAPLGGLPMGMPTMPMPMPMMYPGMYPPAYPGAFPQQPVFVMSPQGFPVQQQVSIQGQSQAPPAQQQPPQAVSQSPQEDFHQLHQQMLRLQLQQPQQQQQEAPASTSGQPQPIPQPQPQPYFYPYPMHAPAPAPGAEAPLGSDNATAMPPPFYYYPPAPYPMPGAELPSFVPYPPYGMPPTQQGFPVQQQQVPTQGQAQAQPAQQQQQHNAPSYGQTRPTGPAEDLLA